MANYKPVKIMFDLEDKYHKKLYEYLKKQTNGSSYIRTLLHLDLMKSEVSQPNIVTSEQSNLIVKEQKINDNSGQSQSDVESDVNSATVQIAHYGNIKIQEDIFIEDLI